MPIPTLRETFGDNIRIIWEAGSTRVNVMNENHQYLISWLWMPLIQKELDNERLALNLHLVRGDHTKKMPSGIPLVLYEMPSDEGGTNQKIPTDPIIVKAMKDYIMGDDSFKRNGHSPEFGEIASAIFKSLDYGEVSLMNVWSVFDDILALLP